MKDNALQFDRSCHVLYSRPMDIALYMKNESARLNMENIEREVARTPGSRAMTSGRIRSTSC